MRCFSLKHSHKVHMHSWYCLDTLKCLTFQFTCLNDISMANSHDTKVKTGTDRGYTAKLCNWRCWEETSERKRERVGWGGNEMENKGRVGGKGLRLSWKLGGISADSFSRPPLSPSLYSSPPCHLTLSASPPFIHSTFLIFLSCFPLLKLKEIT